MYPEITQEMLTEVYADRNRLAQLAAALAERLGYRVGITVDPDEPEWPVLLIDLPTGQVSWHLSPSDAWPVWDMYEGDWDGHTTEHKAGRIRAFVVPPPRAPDPFLG